MVIAGFKSDTPRGALIAQIILRDMEVFAPFIPGAVLRIQCHGGSASARSLVSAFRQRSLTARMDGGDCRLHATMMKSPEMRVRNERLMVAAAAAQDHLERQSS